MKAGEDDDENVWNATAVILDIDSGVYTDAGRPNKNNSSQAVL